MKKIWFVLWCIIFMTAMLTPILFWAKSARVQLRESAVRQGTHEWIDGQFVPVQVYPKGESD